MDSSPRTINRPPRPGTPVGLETKFNESGNVSTYANDEGNGEPQTPVTVDRHADQGPRRPPIINLPREDLEDDGEERKEEDGAERPARSSGRASAYDFVRNTVERHREAQSHLDDAAARSPGYTPPCISVLPSDDAMEECFLDIMGIMHMKSRPLVAAHHATT